MCVIKSVEISRPLSWHQKHIRHLKTIHALSIRFENGRALCKKTYVMSFSIQILATDTKHCGERNNE